MKKPCTCKTGNINSFCDGCLEHLGIEKPELLIDVVDEYLHWRSVNKHIKGGENYLKRLHESIKDAAPFRKTGV